MRQLIRFFERKAVGLKPKIRYAWWTMGVAVATQTGIFLLLYKLHSVPEWSAPFFMPVMVFLVIIMTWAWGVILICSWFKPNRKTGLFVIDTFQACMLVLWFTAPLWGSLWLYLPTLLP